MGFLMGEIKLVNNWQSGYKLNRRPFVSVLDKMIATDLLKTLVSVWFVIVVIIVSRKFIKILERAVEGHISNETLLTILGLKIVTASTALLPAAVFMALLMVLGRLYKDQEMSAIAAAGGGAGTLYKAVFMLLFPISVLASGLSLYVSPWAESRVELIMHEDEKSSDIRGIAAGKFSAYSKGDLVFYAENIGVDNKMHAVFMQNKQNNNLSIISADHSRFDDLPDGRYLVFENGRRTSGNPGDVNYGIEEFKEYAFRVAESNNKAKLTPKSLATANLIRSKNRHDIAELQDRITLPLEVLLFGLLAVPLSRVSPRGGIYGSMVLGFLTYFSFGNLSGVSQSWIIKESIPAWPGLFWVNLLFVVIGFLLLANWYGFNWLWLTLKTKLSK
jgi:lipopolysaccharide export system permease protein